MPKIAKAITHFSLSNNFEADSLVIISTLPAYCYWQARRVSNPQPPVLETAALPIELLAYKLFSYFSETNKPRHMASAININKCYLIIFDTTPAPTVLPPSLIANLRPSSIAIGAIRETVIFILSPGITISTPSGSSQAPVTSVVLK